MGHFVPPCVVTQPAIPALIHPSTLDLAAFKAHTVTFCFELQSIHCVQACPAMLESEPGNSMPTPHINTSFYNEAYESAGSTPKPSPSGAAAEAARNAREEPSSVAPLQGEGGGGASKAANDASGSVGHLCADILRGTLTADRKLQVETIRRHFHPVSDDSTALCFDMSTFKHKNVNVLAQTQGLIMSAV